jgi:hypothetical protein
MHNDIKDVLDVLPECMAETFFAANPEKNERVPLGMILMYWCESPWGPAIKFKQTVAFREAVVDLKYNNAYPLAKQLWELMPPENRERTIQRKSRPMGLSGLEKRAEKRLMRQAIQKEAARSMKLKISRDHRQALQEAAKHINPTNRRLQ